MDGAQDTNNFVVFPLDAKNISIKPLPPLFSMVHL